MTIRLREWKQYYKVQQSGEMNMWSHPLIFKFAPEGNWEAAFEHFETQGRKDDLTVGGSLLDE